MNKQRLLGYALSLATCLLVWKAAAVLLSSPVLPGPEETGRSRPRSVPRYFGRTSRPAPSGALQHRPGMASGLPLGIVIGYDRKTDRYVSP